MQDLPNVGMLRPFQDPRLAAIMLLVLACLLCVLGRLFHIQVARRDQVHG